jgi:glucose/arabinose dehydrogenase
MRLNRVEVMSMEGELMRSYRLWCVRAGVAVFALIATAVPALAQLTSTVFVSGFTQPVAFVQDPSNAAIQYVVEQGGVIRVVQGGTVLPTPFINLTAALISGGEQGLLGLAFPPNYGSSGRFYVCFTDAGNNIVVARFKRSAGNPLVADTSTRLDLQWPDGNRFIIHPFANHNAGNMAFGPDGYLYISMGDGGSGNDPDHRAQNPAQLLGKFLRIDVSVTDADTKGYRIPADNPFVGVAGYLGEIWSVGLRNPWRWSFDDPARGGTGALIIGDVGQNAREEIDYEPAGRKGRNYGWRNREGTVDNVTSRPPAFLPLTDPIYDYGRNLGQCVTGGFVYRGTALAATYRGRYFFADFCSGRIWSLALTISGSGDATASGLIEHTAELGGSAVGNISAFGVDSTGELYLCSFNGQIRRLSMSVNPILTIDLPTPNAVLTQPFALTGWAIDAGATVGTGVSTIHVWAYPATGAAPSFVGVPAFGNRPDVGAAFGSQFTPSGYGLIVNGLAPGRYQLFLFGWVTAMNGFGVVRSVNITIAPSTQMTIDLPGNRSTVGRPFHLAGWAVDTSAPSGTGIDTIHVWAYPTTGGPPTFVGVPALGGARPDVAAYLGNNRFGTSGYNLLVSSLGPGTYDLVVYAHSSVTGTFSAALSVRVTVQ